MRRRLERLNLLLALAYGVYLFMPLAHLVFHPSGASAIPCPAKSADESSLWPDCQGPCEDPAHHHHHHHSHGHAHCLICQIHAHAHALLPTGLSCVQATKAGPLFAAECAALDSSPVLSSGSIRSPPPAA